MDEKGQVSIEYLFMVTVSLILISIASSVVLGLGKFSDINTELIDDPATGDGLKNEMLKWLLNTT
ncbi:MAG: class III signal peptide-containing protein [Candidatus Diapherotrites archaeon]|nr:class III signal peptide-containing protein [Candidatus Diapherotrites archaeon]